MSEKRMGPNRDAALSGMEPTMSLVGKLEDLSLGEILQIVSLSRRSGLLRLEGPKGEATVYIRGGMVIHAGRSDEKEGILSLLVQDSLVDLSRIEELKPRFEACEDQGDLLRLIHTDLDISPEALQNTLRKRIEDLVYSLFLWEEGTFSFQLVDKEEDVPFLGRMRPFFLQDGINAQFLVMEGARLKDELRRDAAGTPSATAGSLEMPDQDSVWSDTPPPEEDYTPIGDMGARAAGILEMPDKIPELPGKVAEALILVTDDEPLSSRIREALRAEGVKVFVFGDAASALTKMQDLRSHRIFPAVAFDLHARGITDGAAPGGLDVLISQWDLGFRLPSVLFTSGDIPGELADKLGPIAGIELVVERPEDLPDRLAALTLAYMTKGPEQAEREGEYYDIQQELSEDLEGLDLPFAFLGGQEEHPQQPQAQDPLMARLGSYVSELNRQDIRGEITLLALRFASEFASRAILFLVRKDDIKGLGQFGVDLGEDRDADSTIRALEIPIAEGSIFTRVVDSQQSYRGAPQGSETEGRLFRALGGEPKNIYIGPVVSMGKVVVILYGDDFPEGQGLHPTHSLDIFLSHAGLALDRAFLEMKLSSGDGET
ncbi:MAG: DUF4388 domain-containing protein [bacterium]|nr:MAG: DUF4388 domain-containing protein [bacterium]